MGHLYTCKWDQNNNEIKYENILGDNIKKKMKKVSNQFSLKYENREKHINDINHPRDPISDPLFSLYGYSNGNITN